MADKRITELPNITGATVDDANDELAIVDASAGATSAITRAELFSSVANITVDGNVGIGTTTPDEALEVVGDVKIGSGSDFGVLHLGDTVDDTKIVGRGPLHSTAPNTMDFDVGSINLAMRIDSSGNVGIGTTSPASDLDVEVATGAAAIQLGSNGSGGRDWRLQTGDTASGLAGSLRFYDVTGAAERMRLSSAGRLYFNVTTDITAGDLGVQINGDTGSIWTGKNSTDGRTHFNFYNPNGSVGSITTTGSATAFNTSSDYRLKEDPQPILNPSDRLMALKPVNFAWKADGTRVDGFLAHEVQEVVPEAATGTKDAMRTEEYEVTPAVDATYDEDGNELTPYVPAVMGTREVPDYQGIDQSKLVPLLTAALQEALNKIDDLEARVAALETV